jgi:hypothetical protein
VQKVKFFKGIELEHELLEKELNEWLAANSSIKIINMYGNIAPQSPRIEARTSGLGGVHASSDILIVVHYEEG